MKRTLRRGILEELEDEQIDAIAGAATVHRYQAGAHIIKKGTPGEVFYIIEEGSVVCKNIGGQQNNNRLTAGDYVGERALLTSEPRAADVFAEEDSVLVALSREDFENILGHLRELLEHNMGMRLLLCVPILTELPAEEKQRLFGALTLVSFEPGQPVVSQGAPLTHFFIMKEGTAFVTKHDAGACHALASQLGLDVMGSQGPDGGGGGGGASAGDGLAGAEAASMPIPGQPESLPLPAAGGESPALALMRQYRSLMPADNVPLFEL